MTVRIWIDRPPPEGITIPAGVVLVDSCEEADGVIVGSHDPWDAAACLRYPRLKVVARNGIGCDNVDVDGCADNGVAACNTPDGPTVSTAEHALALMLTVAKNLTISAARLRRGEGEYVPGHRAVELDGLTLGLVGGGRIGRRFGRYAEALGMAVLIHDPYLDEAPLGRLVELDELWAASHVVSLHAPATPATRHIVNADSLAAMRPGVIIVNCARGPLIDQDALLAALDAGHVAGAGLDVTDPEPLPVGHPLLGHDDVVVTPHVASATGIGRVRLVDQALEQAAAWLRGETPTNLLNPTVLDNGTDRRSRP